MVSETWLGWISHMLMFSTTSAQLNSKCTCPKHKWIFHLEPVMWIGDPFHAFSSSRQIDLQIFLRQPDTAVVYWPPTQPNMPFQRRQKLHILLASYGKRLCRRAWLTIWDRVKILRYSHKLMHWKRVTSELHDSYFHSMMMKSCHSKDSGSCIFCWPVMGRDWVGVELLYNLVHRKFRGVGEKILDWGTCPREAPD